MNQFYWVHSWDICKDLRNFGSAENMGSWLQITKIPTIKQQNIPQILISPCWLQINQRRELLNFQSKSLFSKKKEFSTFVEIFFNFCVWHWSSKTTSRLTFHSQIMIFLLLSVIRLFLTNIDSIYILQYFQEKKNQEKK